MVHLQHLLVSGNQLSGPFPKWLGKLNSPLKIDVSSNMFNGTIPSTSNLTNLIELWLENNTFTGFEGAIFPDAKGLVRLALKRKQLRGPIPPSITRLLNLKVLDLSINRLTGPIPSGFSFNMSENIWIDLSSNQLTGNIPQNFLQPIVKSIPNYPEVNISHNRLSGHKPLDGTQQYNYYMLDFSFNNLSRPIPTLCNNNGPTTMDYLWLQNNSLSGDSVDFLAQCYGFIVDMWLANNSLSGDLSKIVNINTILGLGYRQWHPNFLDLSSNNLQMSNIETNLDPLRTELEFFVLNSSLGGFHMQGNDFFRIPLPSNLPSATNFLQVLDLSSNHLTGEISSIAFNSTWLPTLQSLSLSNNDIVGPISEALVLIPNLTVLDAANNSLSGYLPYQLPYRLYDPSSLQAMMDFVVVPYILVLKEEP